jgi:hypothetical protein
MWLDLTIHNGCRGGKDHSMRRYSGYQAAIAKAPIVLTAVLGLIGVGGCQRPPGNLSDPADFKTAVHALKTDLTKVRHDLKRELRKVHRGATGHRGEPRCYNLRNNVNFVALKTIRNFVQGTVKADRDNVQTDINHIRRDRTDFKKDLADFLNDGVSRPAGARHAIEQITGRIILARSTANQLIRAINRVVREAYGRGNGLAAHGCIGDGPGSQMPQVALVT